MQTVKASERYTAIPEGVKQHRWLAFLIALVAVVALTACTSAVSSDDNDSGAIVTSGSGGGQGGATLVDVDAAGTEPGSASAEAQGKSVEVLSADAIVAAQEEVVNRIYETALPSVVQIRVTRKIGEESSSPDAPGSPELPFDFDRFRDMPGVPDEFFRRGSGTGFIWDEEGPIVTNHHVIDGADHGHLLRSNRDGRQVAG